MSRWNELCQADLSLVTLPKFSMPPELLCFQLTATKSGPFLPSRPLFFEPMGWGSGEQIRCTRRVSKDLGLGGRGRGGVLCHRRAAGLVRKGEGKMYSPGSRKIPESHYLSEGKMREGIPGRIWEQGTIELKSQSNLECSWTCCQASLVLLNRPVSRPLSTWALQTPALFLSTDSHPGPPRRPALAGGGAGGRGPGSL